MFVVTGAGGFLGRQTVAMFVRAGEAVTAVSRSATVEIPGAAVLRVADYCDIVPPARDCVLVDLADTRDLAKAQTAGQAHVEAARARAEELYSVGWGFVVFASSAAVYGDAQAHARREDEPLPPGSFYAQAKCAVESVALARGGAALRFANLYGPGMAINNVLSDILGQLGGSDALQIRDAAPVRDFLHVEDAAEAIGQVARARLGGVWNVGTGRGISALDLATKILALARTPDRAVVETAPSGTASHLVLDASALRRRCGWHPHVVFETGLSQLVADLA